MRAAGFLVLIALLSYCRQLRAVASPSAEQHAACSIKVTDYGAVGDDIVLDTFAIQRALDICARLGGGQVRFPRGKYRAGTLHLRSNVSLLLEEGAVLRGSENLDDYLEPDGRSHFVSGTGSHRLFLYGDHVDNVLIRGKGIIDGNRVREKSGSRGPLSIFFQHSSNIVLDGITVTHSPGWSVTFFDCRHVRILGVMLKDVMADGINPVSCQDVLYDGVVIDGTGDDPICIKNEGPPLPNGYVTRDITIRNTVVRNTSHPGFKIGTGTNGTFDDIVVEDSTFKHTGDLFAIQLMRPTPPGEVERFIRNVSMRHIRAQDVERFLDITTIDVDRPVISGLGFEDIQIDGRVVDSRILGTDLCPIRDVTIRNIIVKAHRSSETWLRTRSVSDLTLNSVIIDTPGTRSVLAADAGRGLNLNGIRVTGLLAEGPALYLTDIQDAQIGSMETPPLKDLVRVSGTRSRGIHLQGDVWPHIETPLLAAADVPDGALLPAAAVKVLSLAAPSQVNPNETLLIDARIRNKGPAGATPLTLFVAGRVIGRKWVWIGPSAETTVKLSGGPFYDPGAYSLQLGRATQKVRVRKTPAKFRYGTYCEMETPAAPGATTKVVVPLRNIGGSVGTQIVELKVRDEVVASKDIILRPGEQALVSLRYVFPSEGVHSLQVGDFPVWSFATYRNVPGRFLLYRDHLVIEAEGRRGEQNDYAAIYVKGIKGNFDAQVRVLSQTENTGETAAVGLILRNRIDDVRSGGLFLHYRVPKYGGEKRWQVDVNGDGKVDVMSYGGDAELPVWYKIEKRGNTVRPFSSRDGKNWRPCDVPNVQVFSSPSIQEVQDIGIYGYASSSRGELSHMEFSDFQVKPMKTAPSKH